MKAEDDGRSHSSPIAAKRRVNFNIENLRRPHSLPGLPLAFSVSANGSQSLKWWLGHVGRSKFGRPFLVNDPLPDFRLPLIASAQGKAK